MAATAFRTQTLSRFVPALVLKQLAELEEAPLEARSDLFAGTALFADISGFTKLSERLGQRGSAGVEELTQTLNEYFGDLIDAVISAGGDIVKFAGDALLAVWPATDGKLSETAQAAAQCGLEAQKTLRDRKTKDGDVLSLRIGIGTGLIATASVGGVFNRWEFLVCGKAIVEATDAASAAERGDVVLGPVAAKKAASKITATPLAGGHVRLDEIHGLLPARSKNDPVADSSLEKKILAYIPAAIRRRLGEGHANWLGELRRLGVLFINLPNLNHETPLGVAQTVMSSLQEALYRYEGSVNKLSADDKGITFVAALGLPPLSHEDDELRAVLAAIDIKACLEELGHECSIGVTSGRVFCGIIGNTARCEYTIIGDVVNLSARLMQAARGGILCDQATYLAANRRVDFETLPPVSLKGKSQPVPVFRPARKRRREERRQAHAPMIGREKEQALLLELQQSLLESGNGAVVIVDGEPGIGKSRMVGFLREGAQTRNITTYIGTALDMERSTPYFAWRGVFRTIFRTEGSDGEISQTMDLAYNLPAMLEEREKSLDLAPLLNPVLATELAESPFTEQLTQEARVNMTNDLLLDLLKFEVRRHRVQIILEDCHWMDSASWTLARQLAEAADDFLLFIITRPMNDKPPAEYARIVQKCAPTRVPLVPLSENDVEALVCRNLGVSELPRQIADLIRTKAQGNPLFGEELAFALRDSQAIRIQDGRCQLAPGTSLENLGFPDTVQGVVTSRIDRLIPSEQLTLKVASVIGRSFSCRILEDMFPVEKDRPLQSRQLKALSQRDLITAHTGDEETDYQFRHVITQEVAYDLIPPTQRQELHRAIAEWYEREHGDDLSPFFALLAKHWSHTDQTEKALDYLEKSGESAARQFANSEVIQFFTQALKLKEASGQNVPAERTAHWNRQVAEACYNIGDLSTSLEHFREALAELQFPFPRSQAGTLASTLAEFGKQFGLKWLSRLVGRRRSKSQHQVLEAARCYERLAQIHYLNNARLQTIHAVFKSLNLAESVGSSAVLARCYANAAVIAGLLLMHKRARYYAARANEVAAEINEPDCTSYVGLILGIYWVTVGEWDIADDLLRNAVDIADRIRARRRWAESAFTLVIGFWRRGDLNQCREYARLGKEAGERDRVPQVELWGLSWWLRCQLAQTEDIDRQRALSEELSECLKHSDLTAADLILGHGLLAAGRWRLGDKEQALDEAFRVSRIIKETNQICHYVLPAYSALFEVYAGSLKEATDPSQRKLIHKQLCAIRKSMWEFGVMYPVGRVQYGLHEGQYHLQQGSYRKAVKAWRKALRLAGRFQMRFLEGLLHAELARHLRQNGEAKKHHRSQARELLEAANAVYYLNRLDSEA